MTSVQQLTLPVEGISCHAWNSDKSMVAICPNNNEILIYETTTWKKIFTLSEHDLLVTSIDWSHTTNKIVSCSHDRNAFVWTFEPESVQLSSTVSASWKPALVILRIDRAALDVKWSHDGLRFAVTSGAKCVPVCTYDAANDWWVCKMVKKFKSTVLCCAFHPLNGQLLATGSADFKCRVFSTFASDVDGSIVNPGPFRKVGPLEFGEPYCELSALGWIHAVAWSPSGSVLAYAGHDSSIYLATLNSPNATATDPVPVVQTVRLFSLPMNSLLFLSERLLIGAGHEFNPTLFKAGNNGEWSVHGVVDKSGSDAAIPSAAAAGGVSAARELFKSKTLRGQDMKGDLDTLKTLHDRPITSLQNATVSKGQTVTIVSSSGLDGRIILWNMPSLELDFESLAI